jgi:hypothetical protein
MGIEVYAPSQSGMERGRTGRAASTFSPNSAASARGSRHLFPERYAPDLLQH